MSAAAGGAPIAARRTSISLFSRIYGFGSIYAKTLRDSRLSVIIIVGLTGGIMLAVGKALGADLMSPTGRQDLVRLVQSMPPIVSGFAGNPVNIGTLGGYLSWKYGPFFEIVVAIWSILALSGTLAMEAQRGSLDIVAVAPFGKRRLALEKLAAHLTGMALIVAVLALTTWAAGALYGTIPADAIPADAAIDFALLVGLIGLACGGIAFALGPIVGRGSAAGIAGIILMAGYLINGYKASVPAFQPLANLTWFGWTSNNLPLAGQIDWPSLIPVAIVVVILLALGVEGFARRDVGVTTAIRWPGVPAAILGVGGPGRISFAERLPIALGWGLAVGVLGFIMGAAAGSVADALAAASPSTVAFFRSAFPAFDLTTPGGLLDLVFVGFGFIFGGFAAATLVSGWGSDEGRGRLEVVLSTPLSRARWAVAGGLGVYGAIAALTVVVAIAIGLGASLVGGDIVTPMIGAAALGLYAAAVAGIGFAVGGLVRSSIAGEIAAAFVIVTFLLDLIVPALGLPGWIHGLALSSHFGHPMTGGWDPVGVVACIAIAIAGLGLGAWGLQRRDISV